MFCLFRHGTKSAKFHATVYYNSPSLKNGLYLRQPSMLLMVILNTSTYYTVDFRVGQIEFHEFISSKQFRIRKMLTLIFEQVAQPF